MGTADSDVGVALFHAVQLNVADGLGVWLAGVHQHLAADAAGAGFDQRDGTALPGGADEFHGKRIGRVGDIEQDSVAFLQDGRVAGKDFGEFFVTRISHVAAAIITTARGSLNEKMAFGSFLPFQFRLAKGGRVRYSRSMYSQTDLK